MNFKHAIIGSGISSLVYFINSNKKQKVFSDINKEIIQSEYFYEYTGLGGNSNIWGGYINFNRHNNFLKNLKYKKFFRKKLFFVTKIFRENPSSNNTYCLTDNVGKIFRINKDSYGKNLIENHIDKMEIKKKYFKLFSNNKVYYVNNLTLCLGNLSLINFLYNSNLIKSSDKISFEDGKVSYNLNYLIDSKRFYSIPMPIINIIQKLVFKKSEKYVFSNKAFLTQKFSKNYTIHSFLCKDLLKMKKNKIRFFLSNHITNLKINNTPIRKFINKKSSKAKVFCSGTVQKYQAGPIVQDLIFDIVNN